jgi:hypothetical protein
MERDDAFGGMDIDLYSLLVLPSEVMDSARVRIFSARDLDGQDSSCDKISMSISVGVFDECS